MVGIDKIKLNIPKKTLLQILEILITNPKWMFGYDNDGDINTNYLNGILNGTNKDFGFTFTTFDAEKNLSENQTTLNVYADLIFQMVAEKNPYLNTKRICRVRWNYYHINSMTSFHIDSSNPNYTSIIYNLHSNDGGTEIITKDKKEFFKSEENEALIFPSDLEHRGISPKQSSSRFSLNIVLY
tara:strand:- start:912 stop:1463 length:552 start_codon:yes stop_codon:yes gene_type:complete